MRRISCMGALVAVVFFSASPAAHAAEGQALSLLEKEQAEVTALVEKVFPSTVSILVKTNPPKVVPKTDENKKDDKKPDEKTPPEPSMSSGSGFIIGNDFVVTNHHVIENAMADGITVTLSNGKGVPAKLVGDDPLADIALLKMDTSALPPQKRTFTSAHWGDSEIMKRGSTVIAIGNPYNLSGSVTMGIVSANNRDLFSSLMPVIQHDAAVNSGNSGGPIFNIYGEVVGINQAILSRDGGSDGISFAIPSSEARFVIAELATYGHVRRGFIGAGIRSVSEEDARALGLPNTNGVFIEAVSENMPAHRAGLKKNDVILSWGSSVPRNANELLRTIMRSNIGTTVPVKVWRDRKTISLLVTPIERPKDVEKVEEKEPEKKEEKKK